MSRANETIEKTDKKLLVPETNVLSVSNRRNARFFIYIAKIFLKKFDTVELKALGGASEIAVQVAENLQRSNFIEIIKIGSESVEMDNRDGRKVSVIRFNVTIKKSKNFDALIGDSLK